VDLAPAVALIEARVPGVQAVYLFGSRASGQEGPASDVDLAVLAPRPLDGWERFDLEQQIAATLSRDVDLVDLRRASTVLAAQVVATGRVLLDAAPTARAWFEMIAFASYARLNEERRGIVEDIRARGTVHG
jgi:predicted nucleotidyltransferase